MRRRRIKCIRRVRVLKWRYRRTFRLTQSLAGILISIVAFVANALAINEAALRLFGIGMHFTS